MEKQFSSMNWEQLCDYEQLLFMKVFGLQVLFAEQKQLSLPGAIELCQMCKELSILSKRRQVIFQNEADEFQRCRIMEFYSSEQFERALLKRKQLFDIYQSLLGNPQLADYLDEQVPEVMMKTADPKFFEANVNLLNISTETVLLWNRLQNEFNSLDSNIIYGLAADTGAKVYFRKDNDQDQQIIQHAQACVQTAAPTQMQWRRILDKIGEMSQHDLEYFDQQLYLQFMWLQVIYEANKTLLPDKARYFCYILKLFLLVANRRYRLRVELAMDNCGQEVLDFINNKLYEAIRRLYIYFSVFSDLYQQPQLTEQLEDYRPDSLVCIADPSYKFQVIDAMGGLESQVFSYRAFLETQNGLGISLHSIQQQTITDGIASKCVITPTCCLSAPPQIPQRSSPHSLKAGQDVHTTAEGTVLSIEKLCYHLPVEAQTCQQVQFTQGHQNDATKQGVFQHRLSFQCQGDIARVPEVNAYHQLYHQSQVDCAELESCKATLEAITKRKADAAKQPNLSSSALKAAHESKVTASETLYNQSKQHQITSNGQDNRADDDTNKEAVNDADQNAEAYTNCLEAVMASPSATTASIMTLDDVTIAFANESFVPRRRARAFVFLPEYDNMLRQLKSDEENFTYVEIAEMMSNKFAVQFNGKQLQQRWQRVARPGLHKGHWSPEESDLLVDLFVKYNGSLKQIQKAMNQRSLLQIRERCKVLGLI